MQHDIAPRCNRSHRPRSHIARQRFHVEVIAHQHAVKPDLAANDIADDCRRHRRAILGIPDRKHHMPGHCHRRIVQPRERNQVVGQVRLRRPDARHVMMAVHDRAPLPRHMLDHRHDSTLSKPIDHGPPQRRDAHRIAAIGPVTNRIMRIRAAHIEHRRAIHIDSDLGQRQRNRARIDPRGFHRRNRSALVQSIEFSSSRKIGPFGRSHPRDPPALLINQDRNIATARNCAQIIGQRAHLRPVHDVTFEQNIACRSSCGEKCPFFRGDAVAGKAENDGFHA